MKQDEYNIPVNTTVRGVPDGLLAIAQKQTLRYLFEEDARTENAIITSAFWSNDSYLTASEPWNEVVRHGAHILNKELMETEESIATWQRECDLSSSQVALVRSLFYRKVTSPNHSMLLEPMDRATLVAEGDEGIEVSRELLAAIGIILP